MTLVGPATVAAAFPLFALGSEPGALGSAGDRLRLRCLLGDNVPSAPIVPRMQQVWVAR